MSVFVLFLLFLALCSIIRICILFTLYSCTTILLHCCHLLCRLYCFCRNLARLNDTMCVCAAADNNEVTMNLKPVTLRWTDQQKLENRFCCCSDVMLKHSQTKYSQTLYEIIMEERQLDTIELLHGAAWTFQRSREVLSLQHVRQADQTILFRSPPISKAKDGWNLIKAPVTLDKVTLAISSTESRVTRAYFMWTCSPQAFLTCEDIS